MRFVGARWQRGGQSTKGFIESSGQNLEKASLVQ